MLHLKGKPLGAHHFSVLVQREHLGVRPPIVAEKLGGWIEGGRVLEDESYKLWVLELIHNLQPRVEESIFLTVVAMDNYHHMRHAQKATLVW
jgi:hypothetical protein